LPALWRVSRVKTMAKKKGRKGKSRKYYGKKRKGGRKGKKSSLAVTLGGAKTAWDVGTGGTFTDIKSTLSNPSLSSAKVTTVNAWTRLKTSGGPLLLGAAISYGDKVPLVGKLYKPVKKNLDGLVRQILGKGWKA